jgi:hypothetical protein
MPMAPTRRHTRSTKTKAPAFTVADHYRQLLTTPANPTYDDYLRAAKAHGA